MTIPSKRSFVGLSVMLCALAACDGSGGAGFLALFGPSVTIVIENDTRFTAKPELFTSGGRNIFEDAFEETQQLTNFGVGGAIEPGETVTLRVPCNSDLELIAFKGAKFDNVLGLPVGDVDSDVRLRRDRDFDCNDTLNIRLSGSLFSFRASVDVEAGQSDGGLFGADSAEDDREIADLLDDLFG